MTGGLGTTNQTTVPLGIFNLPRTGGYQNWAWAPLVSTNGNLVTIASSGSVSTLRLRQDNTGYNFNFLMLVPAAVGPTLSVSPPLNGKITITWTPAVGTLLSSPAIAGVNPFGIAVRILWLSDLLFSGLSNAENVQTPGARWDGTPCLQACK